LRLAFLDTSDFSLTAPGHRYEPLYVIHYVADAARQRVLGLFATPDSFRLNQSPLGAVLQPQAPTTRRPTPLPESLSLIQVGCGFPRLSPTPTSSIHPHGTPDYGVGLHALPVVANAIA